MSYVTRCKLCLGELRLFSLKFMEGPPIEDDGFDLYNTDDGSTTDEEVICMDCRTIRPLEEKHIGSVNITMSDYWVVHEYTDGYAEVLPHRGAEFRIEGFIQESKENGKKVYNISIVGDAKNGWKKAGYCYNIFNDMNEAIQWTKAAISRMTPEEGQFI